MNTGMYRTKESLQSMLQYPTKDGVCCGQCPGRCKLIEEVQSSTEQPSQPGNPGDPGNPYQPPQGGGTNPGGGSFDDPLNPEPDPSSPTPPEPPIEDPVVTPSDPGTSDPGSPPSEPQDPEDPMDPAEPGDPTDPTNPGPGDVPVDNPIGQPSNPSSPGAGGPSGPGGPQDQPADPTLRGSSNPILMKFSDGSEYIMPAPLELSEVEMLVDMSGRGTDKIPNSRTSPTEYLAAGVGQTIGTGTVSGGVG